MKRFTIIILVLLAFIGQVYFVYSLGYADGRLAPAQGQVGDVRSALTIDNCMIRFNEARLTAHEAQLIDVTRMNELAQARADAIAKGETTYGHDGYRQAIAAGVIPKDWGELVTNRPTCTEAIKSFLESPTHKDIVLLPELKTMGIGIANNIIVILLSAETE